MDALIRLEPQLRANDGGERRQETRDGQPAHNCMNPVKKERETMTPRSIHWALDDGAKSLKFNDDVISIVLPISDVTGKSFRLFRVPCKQTN